MIDQFGDRLCGIDPALLRTRQLRNDYIGAHIAKLTRLQILRETVNSRN